MALHGKCYILLSVAICFNVLFILLSYRLLDGEGATVSEVLYSQPIKYNEYINNDNVKNVNPPTAPFDFSESHSTTKVWIAGLVLDILLIQPNVWESIVTLNCKYDMGVHIISKANNDMKGIKKSEEIMEKLGFSSSSCAPFLIYVQIEDDQNRIDRISKLRDNQRGLLKQYISKNNDAGKEGVIIIVDLDLYKLPSEIFMFQQSQQLLDSSYDHDAICAMGSTMNFRNTRGKRKVRIIPFYYDTYATVFLPDTFSHPLARRLMPRLYRGEDPQLVRSVDQVTGNFTQAHIWQYFVEKGKQTRTGNVPVKSCFGGLAMYRSKDYFTTQCKYRLNKDLIQNHKDDDESIMRYANNKENRPCEHVVFHDCLSANIPTFQIAVNPKLTTLWIRD